MSVALRPMSLGEILDRTFQIYRVRFWALVGCWMPLALAMSAIELADTYGFHFSTLVRAKDQGESILWSGVVSLAYYHVSSLLGSLVIPAVALQTSGEVLGVRRSTAQTLGLSFRRWRRYLWLGVQRVTFNLILVEGLALLALLGLFALAAWLGSLNPRGWMAVMVLLPLPAAFIAFLWLGACLALAFAVSVVEDTTAWRSIQRGYRLSKESRWRIAVTWFLVFLGSWIAWGMLHYMLQWGLSFLWRGLHLHWKPLYPAVMFGAQIGFAMLFGPIYPVFVTLVYYDQRIRKEGFDIEWMMAAAGMDAAVDALPVPEEGGTGEGASVSVEGAGT